MPRTHELTVDFVLHGEGPASTWAAQAQVGQPMLIAGPGRSYALDPQAQWLLIAGDESAIPAIATILEVVPDSVRTQVLLEVERCGRRIRDRAGASQCQHPLAASRATPH